MEGGPNAMTDPLPLRTALFELTWRTVELALAPALHLAAAGVAVWTLWPFTPLPPQEERLS